MGLTLPYRVIEVLGPAAAFASRCLPSFSQLCCDCQSTFPRERHAITLLPAKPALPYYVFRFRFSVQDWFLFHFREQRLTIDSFASVY